jgi:FKBP-type peptidyl-prolyl cis-trans isomerase
MDKKYLSVITFLIVMAVAGGIYILSSKTSNIPELQNSETSDNIDTTSPVASESANENMDELKIEDQVVGTGAEAVVGKLITVNYTGTLVDGTIFDSSLNPGRTPFEFTLGVGEVIQGWDQGFTGMKVGGKRKLTIPPSLGYGAAGAGDVIPPNATLVFEVELLKVQ